MAETSVMEYPAMLVRTPDRAGGLELLPGASMRRPWWQRVANRPIAQEYLQPNQAVHALNDRVKRINKLNIEIADWLQVRRAPCHRTWRPRQTAGCSDSD